MSDTIQLFAVKIGDAIGSFAPVELMEQTINDMVKMSQLKTTPDEIKQQIEKAELIIVDARYNHTRGVL